MNVNPHTEQHRLLGLVDSSVGTNEFYGGFNGNVDFIKRHHRGGARAHNRARKWWVASMEFANGVARGLVVGSSCALSQGEQTVDCKSRLGRCEK